MSNPTAVLSAKRADILKVYRHPWVFSHGVMKKPDVPAGTLVDVVSQKGDFLGRAFFHPKNSICLRMVGFGAETIDRNFWKNRVKKAYELRKQVLTEGVEAFRLIHGESDGFPGVTVDVFGEHACLQITTAGMENLKELLAELLLSETPIQTVYERSDGHARKREGIPPAQGFLRGGNPFPISIQESGIRYEVNPLEDQKTGFYCDQRENRAWLAQLAKGAHVLDLFCYTGGFSLAAARAGAASVTAVDISEHALSRLAHFRELNQIDSNLIKTQKQDIFQWLHEAPRESFDLIILDPPSLSKTVKAGRKALQTYRKLNRDAVRLLKPGGILATFSCTGVVSANDFQQSVFLGLQDAHRNGLILKHLQPGADHPVSLQFPEGAYLKGLALKVY